MKTLLLLLTVLSNKTFGIGEVPKKYRGLTRNQIQKLLDEVKVTQSSPVRTKGSKNTDSRKVRELEKEIKRLKGINNFSPTFGNSYPEIPTLSRFMGEIDGNIFSMGQPVGFKVSLKENTKFPPNSYLSCVGTQLVAKYNYRLISKCDLLVTPDGEFNVEVGIKDIKKVDGIEANEAYTGDEEALLGEGATGILASLIDVKKDRIQTSIGFADVPNGKNAILNALLGGLSSANEKVKEHTDKRSVIMAIYDKTPVIVEFRRRFTYEVN